MNYEAIALWSQVVSSILFVAALVWLFRKFLIPAIASAQQAKNEEIAAAERRRDHAREAVETMRAEVGDADTDAAAIRQRAADEAIRERRRALEESKGAGERAVRNAQGELERARAVARDALKMELIEKALSVARRGAREKADAGTDAELITQLVRGLKERA